MKHLNIFLITIALMLFYGSISLSQDSNNTGPRYEWALAGSAPQNYEIGKDENILNKEIPAYYLKSVREAVEGFGTIMKYIKPDEYIGKRVRLTGIIKSENIKIWTGMWMRVDGPDREKSLQFDNMNNRPIKGTNDWTKYEIVLDVPENSMGIAYGVLIYGSGQVWLGNLSFEVVGNDVPTTDISKVKPTLDGWFRAGSKIDLYEIGKDENVKYGDSPSYYLKSIAEVKNGFGTIMRNIEPGEFKGKRVRMTGVIKSENIDNHAGMWMRVDGGNPVQQLQFDNMGERPIKGTNDWTEYEIVLDVPENSTGISYGVLISGSGQVWLGNLSFEVVGDDVPSTNIMKEK